MLKKSKNNIDKKNYLLIGAPNVGKSTFFNKATSSTTLVTNMDRITVEHTIGKVKHKKNLWLVDEPGLYNLSHPIDEEIVVSNDLLNSNFDGIINIVSAQSLRRDLYLTIQAIETGCLNTLVINKIDKTNQKMINLEKMSKMLNNLTIVLASTSKSTGIKEALNSLDKNEFPDSKIITYSNKIENLIEKISKLLPDGKLSKRFISIMFLEQNKEIINFYKNHYYANYQKINKIISSSKVNNYHKLIHNEKIQYVEKIISECINKNNDFNNEQNKNLLAQRKVDKLLLNKWIGIPLFFLLVFCIYFLTFSPWTGGWLQENLNYVLSQYVAHDWIGSWFGPSPEGALLWTQQFVVDGIFGGLFIIISFIPIIAILFTLVTIIQQVGIISRVSILLDHSLEKFGISGRSVVSLLTGFGCNVPAIMMARSSGSKKERIIATLITPFIACSARVLVFSFVSNLIFGKTYGWIAMFALTIFSGLIALLMGLTFSKILFRKQKSFFIVEMVEWKSPDFRMLVKTVWLQLKEFLVKASTIILIGNMIVWLLVHLGPNGLIVIPDSHLDSQTDVDLLNTSFLYYISFGLSYILFPIFGTAGDNAWQLTASLICAIPAKEMAISNLGILFGGTQMVEEFFTTNTAMGMSYMVFLMLYTPCLATTSVIKKETNWKYLFIHLGTALGLAYILSTLVYWITFLILLI